MVKQKEQIWVKIIRILLAAVFLVSGFLKAIDPVASGIKMDEYFISFGMSFMHPLSIYLGFLMNVAEFTLGFMLLFRIRVKLTSLGYLLFMSFFFLLTLWLAVAEHLEVKYNYDFGVVKDCGCFGQEIQLSNLQTFLKNVIILIPTLIIFAKRKSIPDVRLTILGQWIFACLGMAIVVILQFYCLRNLPLKDYSDWKVGNNLVDIFIEQPEQKDMFFIYKNNVDGTVKELTSGDLATITNQIPDFYSSWSFVDRRDSVVQEAIPPQIAGFNMLDENHSDVSAKIINNQSDSVYVLIMHDLDETNIKAFNENFKNLVTQIETNGYTIVGITNSPQETIDAFVKNNSVSFPIYQNPIHPVKGPFMVRDAIRSNPGMILIHKGMVLDKWAWRNFPTQI